MLEKTKGTPMVWKTNREFQVYWRDREQKRALAELIERAPQVSK
jgi:hypothetical protein